jgi:mono/diheme cytochrome c family protein
VTARGQWALAIVLLGPLAAPAQEPPRTDPPKWVAPEAERIRPNPLTVSDDVVRRGKALFTRHCASCHGPGGRGDGPAAAFGLITPRDLTAPAVQARLSDGEIFWKLSTGWRVGNDVIMPAGQEKMGKENDRWAIVHFVRSLRATR